MKSDESKEEELSEEHKAFYKKRTCTICDKIFHNSTHCKIHESKVHHNQGRFKCTECDHSYTNITSLNYHLIVNHQKGVKCNKPSCNITFYNFTRLLQHKKNTIMQPKIFMKIPSFVMSQEYKTAQNVSARYVVSIYSSRIWRGIKSWFMIHTITGGDAIQLITSVQHAQRCFLQRET